MVERTRHKAQLPSWLDALTRSILVGKAPSEISVEELKETDMGAVVDHFIVSVLYQYNSVFPLVFIAR